MPQDLRSYIDLIREHKLLLDIKKEVDPLTNLAGIAYRGENEQGKATMDKNLVIKEATAAGFRLEKEGTMLSRPEDTRDFSVVKIRDKSDRFVLKFVKP